MICSLLRSVFGLGMTLLYCWTDYMAEHETDLIMLLPRPHNWLRTWLLESNTQEVARLATVPVLAVV